ncbi:hypothetical protein [Streptomyces sp. NPDC126933]|uniref:hypothetical protein n=1 Tax=unclassified Streptomyces TaxID=2593676 RepID=UPI0036622F26
MRLARNDIQTRPPGTSRQQPSVPEESISEALRTLNTHVNRVEVLTYKELVDNAEPSLGSTPSA